VSNVYRRIMAAVALAALLAVIPGVQAGGPPRIRVAVTVPYMAYIVKAIGGPYVEVDSIIPPGADPHTYSPPASMVARLDSYDLIVMSGPRHMKAEDVILSWRGRGLLRHPLILYYENYTSCGLELLAFKGHVNPHGYWWGPRSVAVISSCIGRALAEADPSHADWYMARARLYSSEALGLAGSLRGLRVAAYSPIVQYFINETGASLVYVASPSPGSEPDPRVISEVTRLYEEGRIDAFVATSVDVMFSRSASAVVKDLQSRGVPAIVLPIGEPGVDILTTLSESVGILSSLKAPRPAARGRPLSCGWGVAVASFALGAAVVGAWARRAY